MKTKCAWCGKILIDDGHTDASIPVSHGMCHPLCDEAKAMGWSDDITVVKPDTNKPLLSSLVVGLILGCFTASANPARPSSPPVKHPAFTTPNAIAANGSLGTRISSGANVNKKLTRETAGVVLISESFLSRVEQIESGGNPRAIGDNGKAIGSFQFHAAAWRTVNNSRAVVGRRVVPYPSGAANRDLAREFAFDYFTILHGQFVKHGKNPSHADLYAAWNLGFAGYKKRGFDLRRCPQITQRACGKF